MNPIHFIFAAIALLLSSCAQAKTFGIVVGIDDYQTPATLLGRLTGAVNDAELVAKTLRKQGVDLPEARVLTNGKATLANFNTAWNSVLDTAEPGDQIIFSFAGHGAQEQEFAKPFDEDDQLDETFLFYDFDPKNPHVGRLSDDELYALFQQARAFRVLFIADACHAGGMLRGGFGSEMPQRHGSSPIGGYKPQPPVHQWTVPNADDRQVLPHVTYLTATNQDQDPVWEINHDGERHGALSVAFAEAFTGSADSDGHPGITRSELEDYVQQRVATLTDHNQHPDMLPRGGSEPAFAEGGKPKPEAPSSIGDLPIKVTGGEAPAGLHHARLDDTGYRLRFAIQGGKAQVISPLGDQLAEVDAGTASEWNALIAKYRLLEALDRHPAAKQVRVELRQGTGLHKLGERLDFSFNPNSTRRYFLLFDLAGTGQLQFLYPLKSQQDREAIAQVPYALAVDVVKPTGEDDVVAIFCERPQPQAIALLNTHDQHNPPEPEDLLQALGKDCQLGRLAYFTVP